MIDDPSRGRSTALSIGVALTCIVVAGSAVLSFFKPAKPVGDSPIIAEKDSGALYVKLGERLHPALNLTSARLIVGQATNPVEVSGEELAKYPRGAWVGIPGAPGQIHDEDEKDSEWTVCDTARTGAAAPVNPDTGLPTLSRSAVQTTAIGGPLTVDNEAVHELTGRQARLLRGDQTTWLVYSDPEQGVVRAEIDLANSPVLLALGIDTAAQVAAASPGLLAAIPEVADPGARGTGRGDPDHIETLVRRGCRVHCHRGEPESVHDLLSGVELRLGTSQSGAGRDCAQRRFPGCAGHQHHQPGCGRGQLAPR